MISLVGYHPLSSQRAHMGWLLIIPATTAQTAVNICKDVKSVANSVSRDKPVIWAKVISILTCSISLGKLFNLVIFNQHRAWRNNLLYNLFWTAPACARETYQMLQLFIILKPVHVSSSMFISCCNFQFHVDCIHTIVSSIMFPALFFFSFHRSTSDNDQHVSKRSAASAVFIILVHVPCSLFVSRCNFVPQVDCIRSIVSSFMIPAFSFHWSTVMNTVMNWCLLVKQYKAHMPLSLLLQCHHNKSLVYKQ